MARIAITGSSGLIGTALKASLTNHGHDVLPVTRGAESNPAALWDPERDWIRPGAFRGVDSVIHLAGASIGEGRWTSARKAELRNSRVAATKLLVEELAKNDTPPVLVSASGVGYYGNRGDELLTEDASPGEGFLAELVRDWEAEAARGRESGLRVAIMRMGIVLAKEGGALPRLLMPIRFGVGGPLGRGNQWWSWVTIQDTLAALEHAATSRLDGVFNLASPQPARNKALTRAVARAVHRPAIFPVPPFALRVLLGREMADEMLLASQRVLPEHLQASGFRFRHETLDAAVESVLRGKD
jgi:hypothetical protein